MVSSTRSAARCYWVHPEDADVVWAGTKAGLLVSGDAGQTLEPLLSEVVTAIAFEPVDPARVVADAPEGGGLIETRESRQTWTELGLFFEEDAV